MPFFQRSAENIDRKSTRLNSSHLRISYAVFCLKKEDAGIRHASSISLASPSGLMSVSSRVVHTTRRFRWSVPSPLRTFLILQERFFFLKIGSPPKFPLLPHPAPFLT